jgi:hypothetical protein
MSDEHHERRPAPSNLSHATRCFSLRDGGEKVGRPSAGDRTRAATSARRVRDSDKEADMPTPEDGVVTFL